MESGKVKAPNIAPNETKCVERKTIKNTAIQIKAADGCKPMITPKDVATPFPPLKFAKQGKTCPTTATIDVII